MARKCASLDLRNARELNIYSNPRLFRDELTSLGWSATMNIVSPLALPCTFIVSIYIWIVMNFFFFLENNSSMTFSNQFPIQFPSFYDRHIVISPSFEQLLFEIASTDVIRVSTSKYKDTPYCKSNEIKLNRILATELSSFPRNIKDSRDERRE